MFGLHDMKADEQATTTNAPEPSITLNPEALAAQLDAAIRDVAARAADYIRRTGHNSMVKDPEAYRLLNAAVGEMHLLATELQLQRLIAGQVTPEPSSADASPDSASTPAGTDPDVRPETPEPAPQD